MRVVHGLYSRPRLPRVHMWSLASHPARLGLLRMHVKRRPPQEVGGARECRTLRLLLLPKPLTHLALPGSLRGHLSRDSGLGRAGNSTSQSFPSESPRLCPGALEQGFHDSGRRMESLSQIPALEREPELQTTHAVAQIRTWRQQWLPSSFSLFVFFGGSFWLCHTAHGILVL